MQRGKTVFQKLAHSLSQDQEQNTTSPLPLSTFLFSANLNHFCSFQNKLRKVSGSKPEVLISESASAHKSDIRVG